MMASETLRELAEGNKWDCKQIDEGCPEIWPDLLAAADAWDKKERENEALRAMYRETTDDDDASIDAMLKDYVAALKEAP